MNSTKIYRLERPELPWGDYGDILAHGMATQCDDTLELERTGPYVPPISQPWDFVVVTDAFLPTLQASGLTGYDIRQVVKKKNH